MTYICNICIALSYTHIYTYTCKRAREQIGKMSTIDESI